MISDLPPHKYVIPGLTRDSLRIMCQDAKHPAPFNLFWLIFPPIDTLLTATPDNWWKTYDPPAQLAGDCIRVVHSNAALAEGLKESPSEAMLTWEKVFHNGKLRPAALDRHVKDWWDIGKSRLKDACVREYIARCTESRGIGWTLPKELVRSIRDGAADV